MRKLLNVPSLPPGIILRHVHGEDELTACFPVVSQLRPELADAAEWIERASGMATEGYRILAAWEGNQVLALAGYRRMENLIHGSFLYVDDLVTSEGERGKGLGTALLRELACIGVDEYCRRLVFDIAATNTDPRHFYEREGLIREVIGFEKSLR